MHRTISPENTTGRSRALLREHEKSVPWDFDSASFINDMEQKREESPNENLAQRRRFFGSTENYQVKVNHFQASSVAITSFES